VVPARRSNSDMLGCGEREDALEKPRRRRRTGNDYLPAVYFLANSKCLWSCANPSSRRVCRGVFGRELDHRSPSAERTRKYALHPDEIGMTVQSEAPAEMEDLCPGVAGRVGRKQKRQRDEANSPGRMSRPIAGRDSGTARAPRDRPSIAVAVAARATHIPRDAARCKFLGPGPPAKTTRAFVAPLLARLEQTRAPRRA